MLNFTKNVSLIFSLKGYLSLLMAFNGSSFNHAPYYSFIKDLLVV